MKHWKSILLSLLLCCTLCACQKGPDPAEVGEALCKLYVHADTAVSAVLEDWDVQTVKQSIEEDLYKQLRSNLEAVGVKELDETALKEVTSALMKARERIPLEVSVVETEEEHAALQVTVGSLDISGIDSEAAQTALEQLKGLSDLSEDDIDRFVNAYTEALQDGFETADPSQEQSSFVVNFVKENGLWRPEDLNGFIEQLGQHIRR